MTLVAMIPSLFVPLLLPKLVKALGKKTLFLTSIIFFVITSILSYFAGYQSFVVVLIFTALRGIGYCIPIQLTGMFTVDCVEYGAYQIGHRTEGITFSVQTFTAKMTSALSGAVTSFLLAYYGYQANAVQSERALNGLFNMFTIIPVIGYVIMFFIILFFYKLKETDVEQMMEKTAG